MPQESAWLQLRRVREGFVEPGLEGLETRPGKIWGLREPRGSGWKA